MLAVRTPEASRPTRRIAGPRCSLPRRGIGSATSITFDFAALPCGSGLFIRSLTFRPATFLSTLRAYVNELRPTLLTNVGSPWLQWLLITDAARPSQPARPLGAVQKAARRPCLVANT